MKDQHAAEALAHTMWSKLHVELSAGQIRRDMAVLLPSTGESAEGAYITAQLLERAQHAPPLQESWWELPPVGSHGHPPPAAKRRALRWPPLPASAVPAPAASGDRPHRSERAVRRPSRYFGEEEAEEAQPGEEEEGSLSGHMPAAVAVPAAAPAASSGGPAGRAVTPPRGQVRLGSRQAESHAYASVQDLHEAGDLAVSPLAPGPGRFPLTAGQLGGGSPYAHMPVQQAPPWLALQQAGLAGSPAAQPAGFTPWAGRFGGAERRPVASLPPPHPTTPPAAAGGATLPFLQDSQAQRKLVGPAASVLRPPQAGDVVQQGQEHWLEMAAAQLPIPQQEGEGADVEPASQRAAHELMRAIAAATQQPAR